MHRSFVLEVNCKAVLSPRAIRFIKATRAGVCFLVVRLGLANAGVGSLVERISGARCWLEHPLGDMAEPSELEGSAKPRWDAAAVPVPPTLLSAIIKQTFPMASVVFP